MDQNDGMPLLSITSCETIRNCSRLELRESDVFICSYPKSGTTWMQHIILSMLLATEKNSKSINHVSELAPFFEIDAHWEGDTLAPWIQENHSTILNRRVFNTHLRFPMLPSKGTGGKFVYIVRSPLDVCVSFYHHLSHQVEGGYDGTFDSFFDDWLDGKLAFGSWIDHIRSYQDAVKSIATTERTTVLPDGRQLLFVAYEEMTRDLNGVLKILNNFLDSNLSDTQLDELLPTFSFNAMKTDIDRFQPKSVHWKNNFCFLRNGKVGSSKDVVSDAQIQRFVATVKESGIASDGKRFIDLWLQDAVNSC